VNELRPTHSSSRDACADPIVEPSSPGSFWVRLGRAAALVLMAAASHAWLGGAPPHRGGGPQNPEPMLVTAADEPAPAEEAPIQQASADSMDAVRIERPEPSEALLGTAATGSRRGTGVVIPAESDAPVATAGGIRAEPFSSRSTGSEPFRPAGRQDATAGGRDAMAPAGMVPTRSGEEIDAFPLLDSEPDEAAAGNAVMNAATNDEGLSAVAASEMASRATAPPAEVLTEEVFVRETLQEYVAAFERLDVEAAKAIWPTVDVRALSRAFRQLEAQQLTFESCGITITGSDANARCRGDAGYRPKVGNRTIHTTAREWTFDLARKDDGWRIVQATVR
jgi:hypothetical protein